MDSLRAQLQAADDALKMRVVEIVDLFATLDDNGRAKCERLLEEALAQVRSWNCSRQKTEVIKR